MRRLIAVICVGVAFAASAAIALAQNGSLNGDVKPAGADVVFPDSLKGRDAAIARAIAGDRGATEVGDEADSSLRATTASESTPEAEPAPELDPGEIYVPDEPVETDLVEHCDEVAETEAIDDKPLCAAVLLKEADRVSGGIFLEKGIENRYERLVQSEGGDK